MFDLMKVFVILFLLHIIKLLLLFLIFKYLYLDIKKRHIY